MPLFKPTENDENKEFNEANYANKIAKYLQTDHNEAYVSEKELLDVIPLLPKIFSEPLTIFSDCFSFFKFIYHHIKDVLLRLDYNFYYNKQ